MWTRLEYYLKIDLFHNNFGSFAALTADKDTILRISHLYTLEIEIFNRSVLVGCNLIYSCRTVCVNLDVIKKPACSLFICDSTVVGELVVRVPKSDLCVFIKFDTGQINILLEPL